MAIARTAAIILVAANPAAACLPQQPAGPGPLLLNGPLVARGAAVFDAARRVLVTAAANETGKTLTLIGLDRELNPIIEVLTLPNAGSVYTVQDFRTVATATISAAAAGNISVGTNAIASTRWIRLDTNVPFSAVSAGINFGAAVATATLEVTLDPIDKQAADRLAGTMDESTAGLPQSAFVPPSPFAVVGATGIAADTLAPISTPANAVRLTVTAGAATAGLRLTVIQQGVRA